MSLSLAPVKTLLVDDPRIDLDNYATYIVERSAGEIDHRVWTSTTANNSQISFNTTTPDLSTVVASKMYVKANLTFDIQSVDGGGAAADLGADAGSVGANVGIRFAPLMQSCNSITLDINGKSFTENISNYYNELMRYNNSADEWRRDFSTFPSYQDTDGAYFNKMSPVLDGDDYYVNSLSPLCPVPIGAATAPSGAKNTPSDVNGRSSLWDCERRNGWTYANAVVTTNSARRFTFTVDVEEVIPLSPLFWGHREVKGLVGTDKINIRLNLDSSRLAKMISSGVIPGSDGTEGNRRYLTVAASVTAGTNAELKVIYLRPRANVETPLVNRYPYSLIRDYSQEAVAGPNNYDEDFPSKIQINNIQLDGVPKRIYLFVKPSEASKNYFIPDICAHISNINISLGTKPGQLGEASPQDLYRMSVKNGFQGSWTDWRYNQGSVLCIDFAQDMPLGIPDAPGSGGQLNFSATLTCKNLLYNKVAFNTTTNTYTLGPAIAANRNGVAINWTPYCIVVYEGMVILNSGRCDIEWNTVSVQDVLDSKEVRKIPYDALLDYATGSGMYTAGNINKLVTAAKYKLGKAKKFMQEDVLPAAQKMIPYAKDLASMAEMIPALSTPAAYAKKGLDLAQKAIPSLLAAGFTEQQIYAMLAKGQKGGKAMNKSKLKQRALTYR